MFPPRSVAGRADKRRLMGLWVLACTPVAAILACGAPDAVLVVVSLAGVTVAFLSIHDVVALGSALRAMARRAHDLPPVQDGVDYGVGPSTWWRTVPADDPYRAQDRKELVATGSPSASARVLAWNLICRTGCVVVPSLLSLAVTRGVHPCHDCSGSVRTAANSIRSATILYENAHPSGLCPSVEQLKAERLLDRRFSTKDHWGNGFEVTCDPDEITVRTSGPDRKRGTDDDIVVPPEVDATPP